MAQFTLPELESARFQAGKVVADALNTLLGAHDTLAGVAMVALPEMPEASASIVGKLVLFTGTTDETYTQFHRYLCTSGDPIPYAWTDVTAGYGDLPTTYADVLTNIATLQGGAFTVGKAVVTVDTMPTAAAALLGRVLLFTGATAEPYTQYHRYVCTSSGDPVVYAWTDLDVA